MIKYIRDWKKNVLNRKYKSIKIKKAWRIRRESKYDKDGNEKKWDVGSKIGN